MTGNAEWSNSKPSGRMPPRTARHFSFFTSLAPTTPSHFFKSSMPSRRVSKPQPDEFPDLEVDSSGAIRPRPQAAALLMPGWPPMLTLFVRR